jgi:hypothetical protein
VALKAEIPAMMVDVLPGMMLRYLDLLLVMTGWKVWGLGPFHQVLMAVIPRVGQG